MISAIENALASLAGSLPDASAEMRHGKACGIVLATSSRQLSGVTLSEDAPQEMCRKIGRRCDFPDLATGVAVELDGRLHIVTSAQTDPVGASVSFGLSAPLDAIPVIYTGVRRENDAAQRLRQTMEMLVIRLGTAAPSLSDAAGFSDEQTWMACIAADVWTELTDPQISDTLEFTDPRREWETVRLRVASVVRHDGWWMLRARPRGGA